MYAFLHLLFKLELHSEIRAIDVNQCFLVIENYQIFVHII